MNAALAAPRWRLRRLLDAPHRLAFAAAGLMLALSALWWAGALLGAPGGTTLPWALPPAAAHGLVMTFGFMPLYFSGFVFTAAAKWLGMPVPSARELLPGLLPQVAGWLLFLIATRGRDAAFGQVLGAIALGAVVLGWALTTLRFVRMVAGSRAGDRLHAGFVAVGCGVGVVALAAAALGVGRADFGLVRAATQAGLWGFAGLVFATALHRLVPFFSAAVPRLDARSPAWLLWLLAGVFGMKATAAVLDALAPAWPAAWHAARAVVALVAGTGVLALAVRWAQVQPLSLRLLAMLHTGLVWLGLALVLSGGERALMAAGAPGSGLALAATHAFAMGFLGSTLLTLVTRVSCALAGRAVAADVAVWRLFWVLQLAVVARVAGALAGPAGTGAGQALVGAAAMGWAGVCVAWSLRCGRWYCLPRADAAAARAPAANAC